MLKIDHIGIAVKDLSESTRIFETLLGAKAYKTETVSSENVITRFFAIGENKIELLADENTPGTIGKFIAARNEGVHHIAFEVTNIEFEIQRLRNEGFHFITEAPKQGADNKLICFLHPKSCNGVLIELCQDIKELSHSKKFKQ